MTEFDTGYAREPYKTLCEQYPGEDVYPSNDFRIEWGPLFHRGRLDGKARLLIIGQDPAAHEAASRRILVGAAGHRVQGFMAKLGITHSYVMINAFLYSVYGQQGGERHKADMKIAAYRNRWLDALFADNDHLELVVTFGALAKKGWEIWKATATGASHNPKVIYLTHPTQPDSASHGNATERARLTKALLTQWNAGIQSAAGAITHPDTQPTGVPYGAEFKEADLAPIPAIDMPAGLPAWMRGADEWAARVGDTAEMKRRTLTITIPKVAPLFARFDAAEDTLALALTDRPRAEAAGHRYVLLGRVVTMDDAFTVIAKGAIYVDQDRIAAVQPASATPPEGFDSAPTIDTKGTIYPGLIELHNHLPYNVLRLWEVDKGYTNRNSWGGTETYRKVVTGPMTVLGKTPQLLPAVVRYVEAKCLVGGVTTSQGVKLFSNAGSQRYHRGLVRNAEIASIPDLQAAGGLIGDVPPGGASAFLANLRRKKCFLLHLSEGTDAAARQHFLDLQIDDDSWAITSALAGIHSLALNSGDLKRLGDAGASVVWSPLSNLLLYGQTLDIRAAKAHRVRLGLGSDWSFTGSKSLFGELKVARIVSKQEGDVFTDRDLVSMATRDAAAILGWESAIGSIATGKRADLLVIAGTKGTPYGALLDAGEKAIQLVVIDGVARFGTPAMLKDSLPKGVKTEKLAIGGDDRAFYLADAAGDPDVAKVSLAESKKTLTKALKELRKLAKDLESNPSPADARVPVVDEDTWFLELDDMLDPGLAMKGRVEAVRDASLNPDLIHAVAEAAKPLSEILEPMTLDPLTVADDEEFLKMIAKEKNLPEYLKKQLRKVFS